MFISYLEDAFSKFAVSIKDQPFFIYLPSNKFGSEYVFIAWLWQNIKKLNFKGFISNDDYGLLEQGDNILFIDDAIYSGTNIMGSIDELNYFTNLSFNCYIVVGCSSSPIFNIEIFGINTKLFTGLIIPPVSTEGTKYAKYIGVNSSIYFDHKIAGVCSTFNDVYKALIPISPDTSIKNSLYDKYFKDVVLPPIDKDHNDDLEFEENFNKLLEECYIDSDQHNGIS